MVCSRSYRLIPGFFFNFVLNMVLTGRGFDEWTSMFFISSLTHGIGELLVSYMIFSYFIDYLIALSYLYRTGSTSKIKERLQFFIEKELLLIILIIFISAVLEVLVSNRILMHLFERSFL